MPAQIFKLGDIANISAANKRRKVTFMNKLDSTLSYAQAFNGDFVLRFVHVCILNILEDTKSSSSFAASFWASHVHNITVCMM